MLTSSVNSLHFCARIVIQILRHWQRTRHIVEHIGKSCRKVGTGMRHEVGSFDMPLQITANIVTLVIKSEIADWV